MKILSLLGSPNCNGNTAALLHAYHKGVKENHSNVEIHEVFLQEKDIAGCTGCQACDFGKVKYCSIEDDMTELYEVFEEADVLIFATPIYFFSMTAQLKKFIDRLYAIRIDKWRGKKMVLLMTYGANNEEDSGAVNLIRIMEYMADYSGVELVQKLGVSTGMRPNAVAENEQTIQVAYEMGRELFSLSKS